MPTRTSLRPIVNDLEISMANCFIFHQLRSPTEPDESITNTRSSLQFTTTRKINTLSSISYTKINIGHVVVYHGLSKNAPVYYLPIKAKHYYYFYLKAKQTHN